MKTMIDHSISFEDYVDSYAIENLTDAQYELEFQGLHLADRVRYLASKGVNLFPIAVLNQVTV